MIRPEQIANVKFTPVSAGTYSAEEVDAFVKDVAAAYKEVLDQNSALVKKISILAEKVESYRRDEEAIKSALLDAHKMADSVTKDADSKAASLVSDAEKKAKEISDGAEKQASELAEAARLQAGDIVNNARTAVASLQERAQQEADKAVANAKAKANEIIGNANKEGNAIIGESKNEYNFYSKELERIKSEMDNFKSMVENLCSGNVTIPKAEIPVYEKKYADAPEAPVEEEIKPAFTSPETLIPDEPVVPAPAAPAEPVAPAEPEPEVPAAPQAEEAADIDGEEDLDDLFDLFEEGETAPAVDFAANLDNFVPDFNQVSVDEDDDDGLDIPSAAPAAPAASEADGAEDEDIDAFLNDLDITGVEDDDDDDDDITSMFNSLFD